MGNRMTEPDYTGMDRDRLLHFLKLRDRQLETSKEYWLRAAEKALNGDESELRNRVDLAKVTDFKLVQS